MKRVYVAPTVLILFLFGLFAFYFLASPIKIRGGDVGPYKNGAQVLAISKQVFDLFGGSLSKGKVVVFDYPGRSTSYMGEIIRLPGENGDEVFSFEDESHEGNIPNGHYGVQLDHNEINSRFPDSEDRNWLRLLPKNNIQKVVWYPFDK